MKNKSKIFIGIDLAKEKFDVSFFDKQQENEVHYQQFQNTIEGCKEMIAWISNTIKQKINGCFVQNIPVFMGIH